MGTITAHTSCEKEARTRRRKHQGTPGISDKNDSTRIPRLWRLEFPSEIPASSLSFCGYGTTIIALLRNNTSPTIKRTVEFSNEQNSNNEGAVSSKISSSSSFCQIAKVVKTQIGGMTEEFRSSGLPWSGHECRSVIAGGSGVLYCLPALFCSSNPLEQCIWLTQALISVMADYVYVGGDSWIHGIDRFFATANTFVVIFRAALGLKIITTTIAVIPISTFILANRSKQLMDLQGWIYFHFLWHITSSIAVAFTVHLLHTCPDFNEEDSNSYSLLYSLCK
jgi:hypothetical protein